MDEKWPDCIVTLIDLIGTKRATDATSRMRALHRLISFEVRRQPHIEHAYTWNDCVLLLSLLDNHTSYQDAMRAADTLKKAVDRQGSQSYAIAVKGQCIPAPGNPDASQKATFIRASSWAMANCFEIEAEARRRHWKAEWYVDNRIAKSIATTQSFKIKRVNLFGSVSTNHERKRPRTILQFTGSLWPDSSSSAKARNG